MPKCNTDVLPILNEGRVTFEELTGLAEMIGLDLRLIVPGVEVGQGQQQGGDPSHRGQAEAATSCIVQLLLSQFTPPHSHE